MNDDNLTTKLQEILRDAKWTQLQLAAKIGISPTALNTIIKGNASPRTKTRQAIDELYLDVVGRKEVSHELLDKTETEALGKHITVREIITNQELLDKLTLYLTYHTNTIEGSTMTLSDVKQVLGDDNKVLANRTAKEQAEARNHRTALYYLLDRLNAEGKDFRWSKSLILNVHLRLMNSIISDAGRFRNHGVRIMGSRTVLANYRDVPDLIRGFTSEINKPTGNLIKRLAQAHATFEQIHPFSDGNGRTGRLIMFIQALQSGVVPPLVVKERRRAYYKYLEVAHESKDYSLLALFIAESIIFADNLIEQRDNYFSKTDKT